LRKNGNVLIKNFLVSSHIKRKIENGIPGIPNDQKSMYLPPKTVFTPGVNMMKTVRIVSNRIA